MKTWDDYEWDPKTGIARFTRDVPSSLDPVIVAERPQPTRPDHQDWAELGLRPRPYLPLM